MRKSTATPRSVPNRWFLTADRIQAVVHRTGEKHRLEFVFRLSNPEGRSLESELDSDRPGRTGHSSPGDRTRHALDQHAKKHAQVGRVFAREIGARLAQELRAGKFDELVVMAEPRFLGLLRAALPAAVRARIVRDVPREFHAGSRMDLPRFVTKTLEIGAPDSLIP